MIMGQPQTGTSVPGVPGSSAVAPTYSDPARTTSEQQDRLKRLRSWQNQNRGQASPQMQPQVPNPQLAFSAGRAPAITTPGAPVAPTIQNLPFNAANPRGY